MLSEPIGVPRVGRGVVPTGVGGLHLGHGFGGVWVLCSPPDKGSAQLPPALVKLSPLKRLLCTRGTELFGWELGKKKTKNKNHPGQLNTVPGSSTAKQGGLVFLVTVPLWVGNPHCESTKCGLEIWGWSAQV